MARTLRIIGPSGLSGTVQATLLDSSYNTGDVVTLTEVVSGIWTGAIDVSVPIDEYIVVMNDDNGHQGTWESCNITTTGDEVFTAYDKIMLISDSLTDMADAILTRDWTAVTGEAERSALNALRFLRNKWTVSGGTLSVKEEDDSTEAWNVVVSVNSTGVPIDGIDPT